jgi:hypothetical protein
MAHTIDIRTDQGDINNEYIRRVSKTPKAAELPKILLPSVRPPVNVIPRQILSKMIESSGMENGSNRFQDHLEQLLYRIMVRQRAAVAAVFGGEGRGKGVRPVIRSLDPHHLIVFVWRRM